MKKDDIVRVTGSAGYFTKTHIKANLIENLTHEIPKCECGNPPLDLKESFIGKKMKKTGKVLSITETKDGFYFFMDSKD